MKHFKNKNQAKKTIVFLTVFIMIFSIILPFIQIGQAHEFSLFSVDPITTEIDTKEEFTVSGSFNFSKNISEPAVDVSISIWVLNSTESDWTKGVKINEDILNVSENDTYNFNLNDCMIQENDIYGHGMYNIASVLTYEANDTEIFSEINKIFVNIPPTCSLLVDSDSGYNPLTVEFTLDAGDSDGIISWELDVDDDGAAEFSNNSNPTFPTTRNYTYNNVGSYTATLTVTDTNSTSVSTTVEINVNSPNPTADFSYSPNEPDEGEKVEFDASDSSAVPSRSIESYEWDFDGDGDYDDKTGESPHYTWNTPGTKTVRLKVTDSEGDTDTISKDIDIISTNKKPEADAGGPYTGYINENISFNAKGSSDPDGDTLTYSWDFGNGNIKTGKKVKNSYSDIDNFTATLTVTDPEGFSDTDEADIQINNRAPNKPSINGETDLNRDIKYFFEFEATDDDKHDVKIIVDWGDGNSDESDFIKSGNTTNLEHSWKKSGRYKISVHSDDSFDKSSSRFFVVFVDSIEVGNLGYLIDGNSDGTYDEFYVYNSSEITIPEFIDGNYIIDFDSDGVGDLSYDPVKESYEEVIINPKKDPKDFKEKITSEASLSLVNGVKVSAKYTLDAEMKIPEKNCMPGESTDVEVTLKNGKLTLDADVDYMGVTQEGTADIELSLGDSKKIPIPGTAGLLKAPVAVTASLSNIRGSYNIDVSKTEINFNEEGTKTFTITVSDDSEIGDSFDIFSDVRLNLDVGMIIDVPLMGEQSISKETLPMGAMNPRLEITGKVDQPENNMFMQLSLRNPLIWVGIIAVIAGVAALVYKIYVSKKKEKKIPESNIGDISDTASSKFMVGGEPQEDITGGSIAPGVATADIDLDESTSDFEEIEEIDDLDPNKIDESEVMKSEEQEINFCTQCGAPVEGEGNFCIQCGNKLKD